MKKVVITSMVIAMVLGLSLAFADKPEEGTKGNGLPKGVKTFNFNVIGVPGDKNWEDDSFDTGGNGKRIFIDRNGTTLFYIYGDENGGCYIQDHDGTDGKVGLPGRGIDNAGIVLPYDMEGGTEGVGNGGAWDCQVFVRLLGPAGSYFWWKSEYYDEDQSKWVQIADFKMDRDTKFSMKNSLILADGYQDVLWTWHDLYRFRIAQFRIIMGAPPVEE